MGAKYSATNFLQNSILLSYINKNNALLQFIITHTPYTYKKLNGKKILLQVCVVGDTCNVLDAGHTFQAHRQVLQEVSKANSAAEIAAVIGSAAEALTLIVVVAGVAVTARIFVDAKD